MRGQSSVELLLILSVSLAALMVIFSVGNEMYTSFVNNYELVAFERTMSQISEITDFIHVSPGSCEKVHVKLPRTYVRYEKENSRLYTFIFEHSKGSQEVPFLFNHDVEIVFPENQEEFDLDVCAHKHYVYVGVHALEVYQESEGIMIRNVDSEAHVCMLNYDCKSPVRLSVEAGEEKVIDHECGLRVVCDNGEWEVVE
ncbi:MAG: hypothetical protein ACTSVF_05890 [Candidatus Asgardarchaeia archaeon]